MSDLDVLSSLGRTFRGPIELSNIDFEYIEQCEDIHELKDILHALEKEPYWPELIQATKRRIDAFQPLLLPKPPTSTPAPASAPSSASNNHQIIADLSEWQSTVKEREQHITRHAGNATALLDPPIRAANGSLSSKADRNALNFSQPLSVLEQEVEAHREKEKGNDCFRACEFQSAYTLYTGALQKHPSNNQSVLSAAASSWRSVVHTNRALTSIKLKKWKLAMEDCDRAEQLDRYNFKASWRRAQAMNGFCRYADAVHELQRALRLSGDAKHTGINKTLQQTLQALKKAEPDHFLVTDNQQSRCKTVEHKEIPTNMPRLEQSYTDIGLDAGGLQVKRDAILQKKEEGSQAFRESLFNEAIKIFSEAIDMATETQKGSMHPQLRLLRLQCLNNRALAFLRLEMFSSVNVDAKAIVAELCNTTDSIELELLAKARMRWAAAETALGHYRKAVVQLRAVQDMQGLGDDVQQQVSLEKLNVQSLLENRETNRRKENKATNANGFHVEVVESDDEDDHC